MLLNNYISAIKKIQKILKECFQVTKKYNQASSNKNKITISNNWVVKSVIPVLRKRN